MGVNVRLNERHIPVLEKNGQPQVYAPIGPFIIDGFIIWNAIPNELPLPQTIGIIQASINTTPVVIQLDDKGHCYWKKIPPHPSHLRF